MIAILWVGSYLLGSIPFAYLVSKWFKGIDIRTVGSKNPGAANVIKQVGKGPGALVVVLDMAKGLVPVILARSVGLPLWVAGVAGLLAVVGHCWPVFMRFDGGEGMMTAIGAFLGLIPIEFLIAFAGGVTAGYFSKYLSLKGWLGSRINFGSAIGFVIFFFLIIHFRKPIVTIALIAVFMVLLIFRQIQALKTHSEDIL